MKRKKGKPESMLIKRLGPKKFEQGKRLIDLIANNIRAGESLVQWGRINAQDRRLDGLGIDMKSSQAQLKNLLNAHNDLKGTEDWRFSACVSLANNSSLRIKELEKKEKIIVLGGFLLAIYVIIDIVLHIL